jgi:uroporphyrin-III C-methyltransferase
MVAWRLDDRRVLVVGGGKVAAGRVRLALEADAIVTVVAPVLGAELKHRWSEGELTWRPDVFHDDDLHGADMVLACLDDEAESARIAEAARARRIPVNCADLPALCDFWFSSVRREGPVQLALSTNGQAPAAGSRILAELADALPARLGEAVDAFGRLRQAVREADPSAEAGPRRMAWLARVARTWAWDDLAELDDDRVADLVARYRRGEVAEPAPAPTGTGRVRLVGAGPGDPRLLTDAAREALAEADLVLADRLISPEILALVEGELRIARKLPGRAQDAQDELDAWTLEAARAGRDVVRLKCGDPFVFGRGGEELAFLAGHGIEAEVIPGVSSAFAAPLAAGIPTTMRGYADRVLLLTAQLRDGGRPSTPVFDDHTTYLWLMGVGRMAELFDGLADAGFPADWPAAVVQAGTRPEQKVVKGTLATLPRLAAEAGVAAPATIVVGRVVEAAQAWTAEALRAVG